VLFLCLWAAAWHWLQTVLLCAFVDELLLLAVRKN
jgi:hypothetical protein